jgi:hypothetical protein
MAINPTSTMDEMNIQELIAGMAYSQSIAMIQFLRHARCRFS